MADVEDEGIPRNNDEYKSVEYWNKRYQDEDEKEWLLNYDSLSTIIHKHVNKTDRILVLGCGNSGFSNDMYHDGYHNIVNIDYSSVVVSKMASAMPWMDWLVMDATNLEFPSSSFDVVIEKATIDAMMVEEKDPWTISDGTKCYVDKVLNEVSRVLHNGGRFISISFAQPHFRGLLYANPKYGWSYESQELGTSFHHYVYLMVKGQPLVSLPFTYVPPVQQQAAQHVEETESEHFLWQIET